MVEGPSHLLFFFMENKYKHNYFLRKTKVNSHGFKNLGAVWVVVRDLMILL